MKTLILLATLLSSQAYAAFNVCKFDDTFEMHEALKDAKAKTTSSSNHKKFTTAELKLIHKTITTESYYANQSLTEAQTLHIFGDYYEDSTETGSDAGEIIYSKLGTQKIITVHYWPGENEYGAIFEVKSGKTVHIANIGDGSIECL